MREINDDIIVTSYSVIRTEIAVLNLQKLTFKRNIKTCSIALADIHPRHCRFRTDSFK